MTKKLNIQQAISHLKAGEILAIATDTIYGLAVDSQNNDAIEKLFALKQRDYTKTLALVFGAIEDIEKLAKLDKRQKAILNKLLPGAVTVIIDKKQDVTLNPLCQKDGKIAVRIPQKQHFTPLCKNSQLVLAMTSANISGQESAKNLEQLAQNFANIPVLDSSQPELNQESTIIDITGDSIKVVRQGAVSKQQLSQILDETIY